MDEIRAIEKSVSELRTIQNRLKKALKERNWTMTLEIPCLQAIIDEKQEEIDSLLGKLTIAEDDCNRLELELKEQESLIEQQRRELRDSQKDVEKLKDRIRGFESTYEFRILKASNQFLEEKVSSMETKMTLALKVHQGNYKGLETLETDYTRQVKLEKLSLERRIEELEKLQEQMLKDYQIIKKENEELRKNSSAMGADTVISDHYHLGLKIEEGKPE